MLGQIIPEIHSANKRLLFTETFCLFPQDGFVLKLPVGESSAHNNMQKSEMALQFNFMDTDDKQSSFHVAVLDNVTIKIDLANFGSVLGMGTMTPIGFSIGNDAYSILMYAHRVSDQNNPKSQLLHMTVTMYKDVKTA